MARVLAPVIVDEAVPAPKRNHRVMRTVSGGLTLMVLDVGAVMAAFALSWHLRFETNLLDVQSITPWVLYAAMGWLCAAVLVGTLLFRGLYIVKRGVSTVEYVGRLAASITLSYVFTITLATLLLKFDYPRAATVLAWLLTVLFLTVERLSVRRFLYAIRRRGLAQLRVLLIGAGDTAQAIVERMGYTPKYGYLAVGFLDDNEPFGRMVAGVPVLGTTRDLERVLHRLDVDEVLIALPNTAHEEILELIARIPPDGIDVRVAPDLFQLMATAVSIDELGGVPLITVKKGALRGWNRLVKRVMDVVIALVVLIVGSPFMLAIALLVKLTSSGPALYAQERVGYNGYPFQVLKFRSMRVDAEADGPGWTRKDDDRRTLVGSFLRRFSLDELPQFINILIGDMSIVGPRPERPVYVEQFEQMIPRYMERHREKCGLTGWAQVNGLRGDTSIEERTRYDLYYVDHWSLLLDLRIMAFTLLRVLRDDSAY
ncbi:MAG TPA: undecaprenyl-phosphate glucose phosphotransferase [Chloroflexota bacterium]|jgi:exopolysaccharide biosynthesis polyprenyl glycosylphosphotransferase